MNSTAEMMKVSTRTALLAIALVGVAACNRIDTAFVERIQAGIARANENREAFEEGVQRARALFEKIEAAPQGLKNNPQFGYADLYGRVVQLYDGCNSSIVGQNQMVTRLEAILADYVEGKMKKEKVQQEAEMLLKNFEGYRERTQRMKALLDEVAKTYDDLLARWEALPEAEKTASANMPAPQLPNAVNLKGGSTILSTGATPAPPAPSPQSAPPGALSPAAPAASGTAVPSQQQPGVLVSPKAQQQPSAAPTTATPSLVPPKREQ